jgi:hypothetical protein
VVHDDKLAPAYQNVDLWHLKFLQVGPGNTFKEPPERLPDTRTAAQLGGHLSDEKGGGSVQVVVIVINYALSGSRPWPGGGRG